MAVVAVDAMGGDSAPSEPVFGAIAAAQANPRVTIKLVGDESVLERELEQLDSVPGNLSVVHAGDFVTMEEAPVEALRKKKDSSIARAATLVAEEEADAVFSAGNTGATVVASSLKMGMLDGVRRPGITIPVPTTKGSCALLDVGANIKCKPEDLVNYGCMGEVYANVVLGIEKPRVGLLNVGQEDEKGNELVKVTRQMMETSDLGFVGNVEGQDIFMGKCDVAVTDGFVGNVLLKVIEGLAESIFEVVERGMERDRVDSLLESPFYNKVKANLTYDEYGAAPLLGTKGVCLIGHGRSTAKAFQSAIAVAASLVDRDLMGHMSERVSRSRAGST
jgi:glycerol-3-phosphate acyltransferase PlsX